jgi:hypothetical protein
MHFNLMCEKWNKFKLPGPRNGCAKRKLLHYCCYNKNIMIILNCFVINLSFFDCIAKKLEEQCFYDAVCEFNDENSVCTQIDHNAICLCRVGYHQVTHSKPTRRTFCTQGLYLTLLCL